MVGIAFCTTDRVASRRVGRRVGCSSRDGCGVSTDVKPTTGAEVGHLDASGMNRRGYEDLYWN